MIQHCVDTCIATEIFYSFELSDVGMVSQGGGRFLRSYARQPVQTCVGELSKAFLRLIIISITLA